MNQRRNGIYGILGLLVFASPLHAALVEVKVPSQIGDVLEKHAQAAENLSKVTGGFRKLLSKITESSRTIVRDIGDSKITLGLYDAAGGNLGSLSLEILNSRIYPNKYQLYLKDQKEPILAGRAYIGEVKGAALAGITLYKPGLIGGYIAKTPIFGFVMATADLKAGGVIGASASVVGLDNQTSYQESKKSPVFPFDKVKHIICFSGKSNTSILEDTKKALTEFRGTEPSTSMSLSLKMKLIEKSGKVLSSLQLNIDKNFGTYHLISSDGAIELLSGPAEISYLPAPGKIGVLLLAPSNGWTSAIKSYFVTSNPLFGFMVNNDISTANGKSKSKVVTTIPYKEIASWGNYISGTKAIPFDSVTSIIIEG